MTETRTPRLQPALIEWEPYASLEDPSEPDFAEYSMLGQCPEHGLERITRTGVSKGSDPTQLYFFACGRVDAASFGAL